MAQTSSPLSFTTKRAWQTWAHYALLALLAAAALGPFLWLLSTALKGSEENIFASPPQLLPQSPTLGNLTEVWTKVPMGTYMVNSVVVAVITVGLNLVFSTLAAYPLARMKFKGQKWITVLILATMMIPFQVLMIPLYLLLLQLGLTGASGLVPAYIGLAIPFAISGFGIFFIRQALITIPRDLEESAQLDGCTPLQTLWYVMVPLIRPSLATLAIFTFMASWGEFLWPSIILNEPEHFTLPVGLVQLQGQFSSNWRLIAAGTLVSMGPILLIFLTLQRFFLRGNLQGAVKG